MNNPVSLTIQDNIAQVTLNRPDKRNALNMDMFNAIDETIKVIKRDKQLRCVIVNANGEDFCSGLDIKSIMKQPSSMMKLLAKVFPGSANLAQRVSFGWRTLDIPVIMAIHGRCWGGGLQIALGADFRFSTSDASYSVMEARWGLIPDMGGNLALRELVTKDIALKLCMSGEIFNSKQALQYGLLTEVCDNPLAKAQQLAEQLSEISPDSIAANKALYNRLWNASNWRWLMAESWYQIKILLGKNQKIAVKKQLSPDNAPKYKTRKNW